MFPIMLNVVLLKVIVVGNGQQAVRRVKLLDEAGAMKLTVFADTPCAALEEIAGERLVRRLPTENELASAAAVMIVDLPESEAIKLAQTARSAGKLVNIEDNIPWCDFYYTATVRRGDLVIAVSTQGKSPTLARRIKELLERAFTDVWKERLERLGALREEWKQERDKSSRLETFCDSSRRPSGEPAECTEAYMSMVNPTGQRTPIAKGKEYNVMERTDAFIEQERWFGDELCPRHRTGGKR